MKKIITGLICSVTMVLAATPIFAAELNNAVIAPSQAPVVSKETDSVPNKIEINGKQLDLKGTKILKISNQIMVPLRITSEAFGFTVSWNSEEQSIDMDNGKMKSSLTIDNTVYSAWSSKAIGMTAPKNLGVATKLIGDITYIPVEFYKIILTNPNAVKINDSVINISDKLDNECKDAVQIPSPLVNYNTLDEARNAVGFRFETPSILPDGYKIKDIIVISNSLAEIFYTKDNNIILFRTAKNSDETGKDISGNYENFDQVKKITVGSIEVTTKGSKNLINLAIWSIKDINYSISFDEAVTEDTLSNIIKAIK